MPKKLKIWESLLPGGLILFAVGYFVWLFLISVDESWNREFFFDVITGIIAVIASIAPFLIASVAEKHRLQLKRDLEKKIEEDRQAFVTGLVNEMEERRQQFEMKLAGEMEERRQQFETEVEEIRQKKRREERALEASGHEMGSIEGGLRRIAERVKELPDDTHFTIRIPSELRKVVTIKDETDEAIQEDDAAQQGTS